MDILTKNRIEQAINSFYQREYGSDEYEHAPENGIAHIAYTTYDYTGTGYEHELQVDFDLNTMQYKNYVERMLIEAEPPISAEDFINDMLTCDFNDIMRNCIQLGEKIFTPVWRNR